MLTWTEPTDCVKATKRGTVLRWIGRLLPRRIECSWCGKVTRHGRRPTSHTMCTACEERFERDYLSEGA